ncbi:putative transcriptional regulator [Halovivax ruber XH-70]|uniref:Putative transcriptional regulator n=1 Tax=Halovivax ruber (strain DSM 18193 / JCM 13892 / XH-70) TaxID=797302 RepID=L0I769_HALRX|nr:ParB N-terminal domain-containing protein [Halovivax ruber]AGB15400.1 putative transcriptional regulator [Halovivax ruber XH-70]
MNPFNNTLDWSFRGKYARVHGTNRVYEGWVDRIHHKRSSVVLHDATDVTGDRERDLGSVYVRVVETIEVLSPSKTIELVALDDVEPSPLHDQAFEASDEDMRAASRDQFAGGYPVVRPIDDPDRAPYELLNGHKRIEACRRVGLDAHPVEIVEATDEEARELFELAHREQAACEGDSGSDDDPDAGDDAAAQPGGDDSEEQPDLEYASNE